MISKAKMLYRFLDLPSLAKSECIRDLLHIQRNDPGTDIALKEGMGWLCRAQDCSTSKDGGVARHFSLLDGWSASYPETTGYIIPTMIKYGKLHNDKSLIDRTKRMLDWLLQIQLPCGGFQGGLIDSTPRVPVTFNTGQILIGLASAVKEFGNPYQNAMRRAADWLVETQDLDGAWRSQATPFASPGEKAYDTHVAWGLFEAARIDRSSRYGDAGIASVWRALKHQKKNGWFDKCCISGTTQPLTHTLGYALRGVIEAYKFTKDSTFLNASLKTANGLFRGLRQDGFLPGRFNSNWKGTVKWSCLTGSMQVAICWMLLYQYTGEVWCMNAALSTNRFVRRTMRVGSVPETMGGIKGSFPVYGDYCAYQFPNWATKFFVDSNMLEKETSYR